MFVIDCIRKYARELTVIGFSIAVAFFIFTSLQAASMSFMATTCENYVVDESTSPDRKLKVVIFERGCGATTKDYQQISLINVNQQLPDGIGNLLSGEARSSESIRVKWKSNTLLEISGAYWEQGAERETALNGVQIRYK